MTALDVRFRDVAGGPELYGFPPSDLVPRLRWLGADYAALLVHDLGQGLMRQDPGTRLRAVRCEADPLVKTIGVDHAGVARAQDAAFSLEVLLADGTGRPWRLRGRWTYVGRDLGTLEARITHYWQLVSADRI